MMPQRTKTLAVFCFFIWALMAGRLAWLQAIGEKIRANTAAVLTEATARRIPPREAAVSLAAARVRRAMTYRRWSIF